MNLLKSNHLTLMLQQLCLLHGFGSYKCSHTIQHLALVFLLMVHLSILLAWINFLAKMSPISRISLNTVGTSSSSRGPQHKCYSNAHRSTSETSSKGYTPTYIDLGECDQVCEYCGALFWHEERVKGHSPNRCCRGVRVRLPLRRYAPEVIKKLFRDRHFMDKELM